MEVLRQRWEWKSVKRCILLTGPTGFLGRHVLAGLLLSGRRVAALVRGPERLSEALDWCSRQLGRTLPPPIVLQGDLNLPTLGLCLADRAWLGRECAAVVHTAARVDFRPGPDGEPWRTNVEGTRQLLRLARGQGIERWHHVSTAFVCGLRNGPVREDQLGCGQEFRNPYEESKFEAERLLRGVRGLGLTVYRPSVIVGDSRTGATTSYNGLYRFLELAARLARHGELPLRLPLDGDETCDLVPVDWVARATVELLALPPGLTYHLVARPPTPVRLIQAVAVEELGLRGVELVGRQGGGPVSRLEETFLEGAAEYWPYLAGTPAFDDSTTVAALPDLPPPKVDGLLLRRLVRFAVADRWGRRPSARASGPGTCAAYIEEEFPRLARRSGLARAAGLDVLISFDIRGPGGGRWSCRWERGELAYVTRGLEEQARVTYHTDVATFESIVRGREAPQQAFFDERLAISGDLETALKLAALFAQFLQEAPTRTERTETDVPSR
jgi:thioester reductase-like protein